MGAVVRSSWASGMDCPIGREGDVKSKVKLKGSIG
jgi:hypothetical protein